MCERDTNVGIVSDHGIGPVPGQTVYVNELLKEHGFVKTKSNPTNLSLSAVKEGRDDSDVDTRLAGAIQTAKRVGFDPTTAYKITKLLGVDNLLLGLIPQSLKQSLAEGVDWRTSAAYCRRKSEQGIRINLEGRDPEGVVPPTDYERVREEVVELLSSLKTASGEPIFELVSPREEVYEGRYTDDACDVLFRTTGMDHDVSTHFHGRTIGPGGGFSHKRFGMSVASGPDIRSVWESREISILDIAPTLIALLGAPIPDRMVGSVPAGVLSLTYESRRYGDVPFGRRSC